jgi:hypothetical protein
MQVTPDWTQHASPAKFEAMFHGLKFAGPGWYLTDTDSVLVTPLPPHQMATVENVWDAEQPEDTLYHVSVWNCPYHETILAAMATAPNRYDTRSKLTN